MIQSRLSDLEYYTEQIFDGLKSIKTAHADKAKEMKNIVKQLRKEITLLKKGQDGLDCSITDMELKLRDEMIDMQMDIESQIY
ncbi:hypothetical protein [Eremococcus coleocola]|uniref:hypothetical protein n=1 Tax=Eremococcus coleocola TaxID=88132 RepID=UPI0012DDD1DA|nr:hypothetical protein [Eremococcus coleocola]